MDLAGVKRERILILGAAGRDFHNFNVFFRSRPQFEVVGFTAAQIPQIACAFILLSYAAASILLAFPYGRRRPSRI